MVVTMREQLNLFGIGRNPDRLVDPAVVDLGGVARAGMRAMTPR